VRRDRFQLFTGEERQTPALFEVSRKTSSSSQVRRDRFQLFRSEERHTSR